jgi:oligoendopeptidase F
MQHQRLEKKSGAYSHPTVPSVHPYIMMNFHGKVRDVMTLAHELGHGVHQELFKSPRRTDGGYSADSGRNCLGIR